MFWGCGTYGRADRFRSRLGRAAFVLPFLRKCNRWTRYQRDMNSAGFREGLRVRDTTKSLFHECSCGLESRTSGPIQSRQLWWFPPCWSAGSEAKINKRLSNRLIGYRLLPWGRDARLGDGGRTALRQWFDISSFGRARDPSSFRTEASPCTSSDPLTETRRWDTDDCPPWEHQSMKRCSCASALLAAIFRWKYGQIIIVFIHNQANLTE